MKRLILTVLFAAMAAGPVAAADPETVVREDVRAMAEGDGAALLALFDEESRIFALPTDPERLTGELSTRIGLQDQRRAVFLQPPPGGAQPVEIVEMVSAGDLVVARLKAHDPQAPDNPTHTLVIFRIEGQRIVNLWHVARMTSPDAGREAASRAVIRRLAAAGREGDVEAVLAQFSPEARNFSNSGDPHRLGDRPLTGAINEAARRAFHARMFMDGSPAQIETSDIVTLGDLIVTRRAAPRGAITIRVYRILDGRIAHSWCISAGCEGP